MNHKFRFDTSLVLISFITVFLMREFYFVLAPWVYQFNKVVPEGLLTPWIKSWTTQRDGIEIYILYSLLIILPVCVGVLEKRIELVRKLNRLNAGRLKNVLLAVGLVSVVYFLMSLKLTVYDDPIVKQYLRSIGVSVIVLIISISLLHMAGKFNRKETFFVFVIAIVLTSGEASLSGDVIYIFAPAKKY